MFLIKAIGAGASLALSVHLAIAAWVGLMLLLPGHIGWSVPAITSVLK